MQARADTRGGFNERLGPQRAASVEVGARGRVGGERFTYAVALYRAGVRDAIVQFLETNGRAFFQNAGRTRNRGVEVEAALRPARAAGLTLAYTYADHRFAEYRQARGTTVDTLDGKRVPGVPAHFVRVGLRTEPWPGATLDVDHSHASSLFADDRNALRVDGWGAGVTNARLSWRAAGRGGRATFEPFAGASNLFGRRYVGAVTVNGAFGRVLEPAPGRSVYAGAEVGWGTGR
jgi:iron complex outermembrane receptor protein